MKITQQKLMLLLLGAAYLLVSCNSSTSTKGIDEKKTNNVVNTKNDHKKVFIPGQYVVLMKEILGHPAILHKQKNLTDRLERYKENEPIRAGNIKMIKVFLKNYDIKESAVKYFFADAAVGFCAVLSTEEVKKLSADEHIEGVYQDAFVKFQSEFGLQEFTGSSFDPYKVQPIVALAGGPHDGAGKQTWIWILDSGIDLDHPDLNVQSEKPYATDLGDGRGNDDFGHGTMVAGFAAAKNNTVGTCGVSSGATVVPVKIGSEQLNGYGTTLGAILGGLDHVAKYMLEDDVVNLSFTFYEGEDCASSNTGLIGSIKAAVSLLGWSGVWVCIGAGNDESCNGSATNIPACINNYRVYTIGALNQDLTCASYSNWGEFVDWAAVGTGFSTYLRGKYSTGEGTSFATPIVAGIIHSRGRAPVSSGTVSCCLTPYNIANLSTLSKLKFDVDLELDSYVFKKVGDLDGNEDLYGQIKLVSVKAMDKNISGEQNLWKRSKENAVHEFEGTFSIDKRINIATGLTFAQLRNLEIKVGGDLHDEEGLLSSRNFVCNECTDNDETTFVGFRLLRFSGISTTLNSIDDLSMSANSQQLSFGGDQTFELNYYESNNKNDGWVKVLFKVFVTPKGLINRNCSSCHANGI